MGRRGSVARGLLPDSEEDAERKARPRWATWVDRAVGAELLVLGIGAAALGLVYRPALGSDFAPVEEWALLICAGGVAALTGGANRAIGFVFPRFGDLPPTEEMPTLAFGIPFFALGLACFVLAVLGFRPSSPRPYVPVYLIMASAICLFLALVIPLGASVLRSLRK